MNKENPDSVCASIAAKIRWGHSVTVEERASMSLSHLKWWKHNGKSEEKRFWEKVDKNGPIPPHVPELGECWVWIASKGRKGYGEFGFRKRVQKAHRVAWIMEHGPIPEGMCVCHKCDNRACIRESHLFLGTTGDNTRDSVKKGRFVSTKKGENHCHAKLTEKKVLEIREAFKNGASITSIAKQHGVVFSTISSIIKRETWHHF